MNMSGNTPAVSVTNLRAEQTESLLGTEVPRPSLSWCIESARHNTRQVRYRIRAAASAGLLDADEMLYWDSGDVVDDATFGISYNGPPLESMQRIWWDVEIQDNAGRVARSEPAWMEAGLTSGSAWRSDWIEAEDELAREDRMAGLAWIWGADPLDPRLHAFRLDFIAPPDLVRSEIFVAGKDDLVAAWANGCALSLPGERTWGSLLPLNADIQPGRNSLSVAVLAETEGFFPADGGAVAVLVRMHRADGSTERIVSGPEWRVRTDPEDEWYARDYEASGWGAACASASRVKSDPRPPEPAMYLRSEFMARGRVVEARLYATALGAYEARINGKVVSNLVLAPEISVADSHVLYQCFDVTGLVETGNNALAFTVADGFYASAFGWRMERYSLGQAPRRLRAQLRLDYSDGSTQWIGTGRDWRIADSPVLYADIYGGETFDAGRMRDGWDLPGFDDSEWPRVEVGTDPGIRLVAQTSPPIRPRGEIPAVAVTEPLPGRFVFDFGQNLTGWVRLTSRGPAGTEISLAFAELLNTDGTADQSNLRFAGA